MSTTSRRALRALVSLACLWPAMLLAGCSPSSDTTFTVLAPSEDPVIWHPVANYLEHRCGDLDCHGDPQRNFVVWGNGGLRLQNGPNLPLQPPTTDAEYDATYRSLVGLEPVTISDVVAGHGHDPEELTFIRKAEGLENHKGGTLIVLGTEAGIAQDDCLTTWLETRAGHDAGTLTTMAACRQASSLTQ